MMNNKSYIPNVLLLGNGINRTFGDLSWGSVIDGLSTGEFDYDQKWMEKIKTIPFSLQTIVISSDSVSDGMKNLSKKLLPSKLEEKQANLLKDLISLPFDAILTTNYSYEIETAINPCFMVREGHASKYRHKTQKGTGPQEQFGIYTYLSVEGHNIWHIHGEAARYNSMVMGHYYYGKLLGEIQKRVPELIRKYKALNNKGVPFEPHSWIDYFLLGNVYIVGFGMDPSEMDIWWLINCKKRDFPQSGKVYLYEPNLGKENRFAVKALCETFNITYNEVSARGEKQYIQFYEKTIKEIETLIH